MSPAITALALMGLMLGPAILAGLFLIWYDHGSETGLDPCATRKTCKARRDAAHLESKR